LDLELVVLIRKIELDFIGWEQRRRGVKVGGFVAGRIAAAVPSL